MATATRSVRVRGQKGVETTMSHAVRTPNDTWARAKAKAQKDGLPINRVIIELLEGYARNIYKLPKRQTETVRVYADSTPAAPAPQPLPGTVVGALDAG